jgi:hypothetical protein
MRYGAAVGLAVLLILAGCQGAPGTDGAMPSPIGEDTPVRTDATNDSSTSGADGSFSYPAGASPDGVDPSALPETHHESLLAHQRYVLTRSQSQGNATYEGRFTVDHARQLAVGVQRVESPENERATDVYATSDTVFQRTGQQVGNGSFAGKYQDRQLNWTSAQWTARPTIAAVLETYQFEAETVVSRNGSRLLRYRSTGPRNRSSASPPPLPTNGSATVEIDERGVVRSMVVHPRPERNVSLGLTVSALGSVGVARPEWVDVAIGPEPVDVPAANLSANTTTVELDTANETLETTAVWIHHDGGESVDTSELDVTANRARAYDVGTLSTTNDTFRPVAPFDGVGPTFDPGESVRIVHTVPPELYAGTVGISGRNLTVAGGKDPRFASIDDDRSIHVGHRVHVLWNRSRPQTVLTYTVGASRNKSTTDGR